MLDQRSDSWRKVSWLAGIGAIVGGPVGYGVGSALDLSSLTSIVADRDS